MRVIAVLQDGPKRGLEIALVGQSAVEVLAVPEVPIPPPVDLGPPAPGESVRRVAYWYRNSQKVGGPPRYAHVYLLDPGDHAATWTAQYPPPSWELPEGSRRKAARPLRRS